MLETPREAMLKAENARLIAENAYMRRAIEAETGFNLQITPIAAVKEVSLPILNNTITLPCVASIEGKLSRYGNFHVLAKLSYAQPEDLEIKYYAPGDAIKGKADYAINQLLPYMHELFIQALAMALRK